MLKSVIFALVAWLMASCALAQQGDALWRRAQDHVLATKGLIAGAIDVDTVVTDGKGDNLDTIQKKSVLTGWKAGEPVRTVVSLSEAKKSGLGGLKFEWDVANHPENGLMDGSGVTRRERAVLDGKACVIFLFQGQHGKLPFKATAWIEEASARPLRVDYSVTGVPMAKGLSYSVQYGRDAAERWLPALVKIEAALSAVFYTINIHSTQRLSNWTTRPASPP